MRKSPPCTFDSLTRRFWEKVDKRGPDECWRWTGSHNKEGRGQLWVGGERQVDEAHRVSFRLHNGYVPDRWETGNVVHHTCKVIDCVNPAHLQMVTQEDNVGPLAEPTPAWLNKNKTECHRGHPLSGSNLAVKRAHGQGRRPTRICLTCYPNYWLYSVERRDPPPGARKAWVGPFRPDQEAA